MGLLLRHRVIHSVMYAVEFGAILKLCHLNYVKMWTSICMFLYNSTAYVRFKLWSWPTCNHSLYGVSAFLTSILHLPSCKFKQIEHIKKRTRAKTQRHTAYDRRPKKQERKEKENKTSTKKGDRTKTRKTKIRTVRSIYVTTNTNNKKNTDT